MSYFFCFVVSEIGSDFDPCKELQLQMFLCYDFYNTYSPNASQLEGGLE